MRHNNKAGLRLFGLLAPTLAAFLVQWQFWPFIRPFSWLAFYPAVFITAWFGGLRAGLVATLSATVIVWWFFIQPQLFMTMQRSAAFVSAATFIFCGVLFSFLLQQLRKSSRQTTLTANQMEQPVNSAVDAIISCDHKQRIVMFNAAAERIFGYTVVQVMGKPVAQLMPQLHWQLQRSSKQWDIAGPSLASLALNEQIGVRANGEEFPLELSLSSTEISDQKVSTLILRDLTERKRFEESEELLTAIVESSADAIIAMNLQGTIRSWNSGAEIIFGYCAQDIIGKPIATIIPSNLQAEEVEMLERVRRGERVEYFDTVRCRDDGSRVAVSIMLSPIKDGKGAVIGVSKVARDITQHKKIEADLQASEDRFQRMFDSMLEGCQIISFDWRYLYLNDSIVVHSRLDREKLIGRTVMESYPGIEFTEVFLAMSHCMSERIPQRMQNKFEYADGTYAWFDLSIQPSPQGIFILSVDITEQKIAEGTLQFSEERYRQIVETAQEGIWQANAEGQSTLVNAKMADMLGHTISELMDRSILDFLDTPDAELIADVSRRGRQGITEQYDFKMRHKFGHEVWTLVNTNALYDDAGNYVGALLMVTDITERKRVAAALLESEKRLTGTLDHLLEGCSILSNDWHYLYVNDTAARQMRTPKKDFFGKTLLELFPGVESTNMFLVFRRCMEQKTTARIEEEFTLLDGTRSWFELNIQPAPEGLFILSVDVSFRKQALDALRISEQSLAITLQSIGDAVIATDSLGIVTRMNVSAERMTGWNVEDAIDKPLAEIFHIVDARTHMPVGDPVKGVMMHGQVISLTSDTTLLSLDGTEYQISYSVAPIRDLIGHIEGAVLVISDVTEQYRAQQAIQASERRFRLLADSVPQLIWTCDHAGVCDFLGEQWVNYTGLPTSQLLSNNWREVTHPEDYERIIDTWGTATTTLSDYHTEVRIRRHDGVYRWFDILAVPLLDEQGRVTKWVGANTDIDERKRAEESQLRTQKMEALGTLAGGIAHDFNNILLAINGNTKLAIADLPAKHPIQENLGEIRKAAGRASDLVRRILAFSRQQEPKREVLSLQLVVEEALQLLRPTLPAMVEVRTEFCKNVPSTLADSTQIHQIVMNLITNAAYAIGARGGVINIVLDVVEVDDDLTLATPGLSEGFYARLTVTDNGCGMDAATKERIFDPFFTTKPVGQGTGLGLSVVDGIMRSHGGVVAVYSQPQKGTTFRLYFPATAAAAEQMLTRHTAIVRARAERVLYVDDEDALVLLVARVLKRLGYEVTSYTDPMRALAEVRQRPMDFDVVVTDLSMPTMSGFELAHELLAIRPDLPILLTSGFVRPEEQETALRMGLRGVILKPNTIEELGVTLDRLFQAEMHPSGSAPAMSELVNSRVTMPSRSH